MDQESLTKEEELRLKEIFADPKRKLQFLTVVSAYIKDFETWYAQELHKEKKISDNADVVSKLRKIIADS